MQKNFVDEILEAEQKSEKMIFDANREAESIMLSATTKLEEMKLNNQQKVQNKCNELKLQASSEIESFAIGAEISSKENAEKLVHKFQKKITLLADIIAKEMVEKWQ